MKIPSVSAGDLPRTAAWPTPRRLWSVRSRLTRPSTTVHTLDVGLAELFDLEPALDGSAGLAALGPDHCLAPRSYESRPFIDCTASNVLLTRAAKAVVAPGRGLIEEFNVGSREAWPRELLSHDFRHGLADWKSAGRARVEYVPGVSVPFCHYGLAAFGHFVLDGLLQIYLNHRALTSGEAILVHWPFEEAWMSDLIAQLDLPRTARRVLRKDAALLETARLSSALAGHGVYFPAAYSLKFFDWLRERLVGTRTVPTSFKRLYIRRRAGGRRPVHDQDQLEGFLRGRGFEILDPHAESVSRQAQRIAGADLLLSSWGSGLALAPLLGGARRVLELTPETVTDVWFSRQAAVNGLRYTPIIHPSTDGSIRPNLPAIDQALGRLA